MEGRVHIFIMACALVALLTITTVLIAQRGVMSDAVYQSRHALGAVRGRAIREHLLNSPAVVPIQRSIHGAQYQEIPAQETRRRIVAIGDVHGDVDGFAQALSMAGAIDESRNWIAGDLIVVQVGDQVDRGNTEKALFELVDRLQKQAADAGGALHILLGNHEMMNAFGAFNYVTDQGFADFSMYSDSQTTQTTSSVTAGRAAAFAPGGPVAKAISNRPITLVLDDILFVHAGITQDHVEYGLDRMNKLAENFLNGNVSLLAEARDVLMDAESPLWTRRWSDNFSDADCSELREVLDSLNVKRMVIGHTLQPSGITTSCNESLWRIDTGISEFFRNGFGSKIQVAQFVGTNSTIISQ